MHKGFLDTSVLLGKTLKRSIKAASIFDDPDIEKYTNEYALKELFHVLKKQYHYSEMEIGYAINYIGEKCKILPMPKPEAFQKMEIQYKSDRPMVYSAYKYGLVPYIDDERTFLDAQKYVQVKRVPKDK